MVIETITEILQSRTYQTSSCKHCGRKIERTVYERKDNPTLYGGWYHSRDAKHMWTAEECYDIGAQPPQIILNVECENCKKPLIYKGDTQDNEAAWVHLATNSWFCDYRTAEPE